MTDFSIITVVYNDVLHIIETMNSVISQSYKQIEYILIDGGSTDGTKEKIIEYIYSHANVTVEEIGSQRHYLEATHKDYSTFTLKFLSEQDRGIYDAMNKGATLATKKWINFMNCGDRFYSPIVLDQVKKKDIEKYDVVYGDTQIVEHNKVFFSISSENIRNRMPFCHQSSFIKTCLFKNFLFDISYKICADNDFFMRVYYAKNKFKKLNIPISNYSLNGLSSSLSWQFFCEECKISFKHNRLFPLYLAIKWIFWTIPKKQIKKILL